MSLSTYYLEYDRHLARLHCRRRHAYAPTSYTASHDYNENSNSWVAMSMVPRLVAGLKSRRSLRYKAAELFND